MIGNFFAPHDFHRKNTRDRLRVATDGTHRRVDALYSIFPLNTRAGYRTFLEAHSASTPKCEAILSRSGAAMLLGDWERRRRAPALFADLADLGAPAADIPEHEAEPVSTAYALGMLYVLEGSRLGGAVLAQRVRASGCPVSQHATRYLRHGEGERFWPTFVDALNASPLTAEAWDEVLNGAMAAFDVFSSAAVRAALIPVRGNAS